MQERGAKFKKKHNTRHFFFTETTFLSSYHIIIFHLLLPTEYVTLNFQDCITEQTLKNKIETNKPNPQSDNTQKTMIPP